MPVIKGLEWTFNTEAEKYEKMRPGYVPEILAAKSIYMIPLIYSLRGNHNILLLE
ncbi:hypothetical protein [Lacrimispora sp.]|uniref:hypothetical protein n=1 Tax=Lacrimispora sp. TaxID=2719234 RepID=UPI0028ABAD43|nr:hypothetical protein [Lacrimispora sp.]